MTENTHLRRRKDGVEVITLPRVLGNRRSGSYGRSTDFWPVRYVESGRKGYLKTSILTHDWDVLATNVNVDARWAPHVRQQTGPSAAALEELRERDIRTVRKRILEGVYHPQPGDNRTLQQLNPSPNAVAALEQAIHMILSGS